MSSLAERSGHWQALLGLAYPYAPQVTERPILCVPRQRYLEAIVGISLFIPACACVSFVLTARVGPGRWDRTTDLTIIGRLLFQLSYTGMVEPEGVEPSSLGLKGQYSLR